MLMKVGATMMILALVLAAGVAVVVGFYPGEAPETTALSAEPSVPEATLRTPETEAALREDRKAESAKAESAKAESAPQEERPRREEARQERPRQEMSGSRERPPRQDSAAASKQPDLSAADWPRPTGEEIAAAEAPRRYQTVPGADMTLTVEAIGVYDVPVTSSTDPAVLDAGLMHEPETSLPSDGGAQRNVFIAGHYLGYPGTGSRLVFYNLDELEDGDEIVLEDGADVYRYEVSESFAADPSDSWVMGQVRNRDMLTLQTCIPPDYGKRLIVRADRV